jgi:hypothetical protein
VVPTNTAMASFSCEGLVNPGNLSETFCAYDIISIAAGDVLDLRLWVNGPVGEYSPNLWFSVYRIA